jgi:hypothetical protein
MLLGDLKLTAFQSQLPFNRGEKRQGWLQASGLGQLSRGLIQLGLIGSARVSLADKNQRQSGMGSPEVRIQSETLPHRFLCSGPMRWLRRMF